MSNRCPVILLAFANAHGTNLKMLQEESKGINRALQLLHDDDCIELFREEQTSLDDIFEHVHRFKDRMIILHYGGHANGTTLNLEDQRTYTEGLAKMLGKLEKLKLVFLNGCSTKTQVQLLLDAGVKAVIATENSVDDQMAKDFALSFYRAFAQKYTKFTDAFDSAIAYLKSKYESFKEPQIYRHNGRGFQKELPATIEDRAPWGVYLGKDSEDIHTWTLPVAPSVSLLPSNNRKRNSSYKPNEYLIEIVEEMIKHKPERAYELIRADPLGGPSSDRAIKDFLIKNFPWPIGAQIRILVAKGKTDSLPEPMDTASIARIKQLVFTYFSTCKFLSYILMSELWDEKEEKKGSNILAEELAKLVVIVNQHPLEFDYFEFLRRIQKVFDKCNVEPVIEEFRGFLTNLIEKDELFKAHEYIKMVREHLLVNEITGEQIEDKCRLTEEHLAAFLKEITFLIKYPIYTVSKVSIHNHKHLPEKYYLSIGLLSAYNEEQLDFDFREFENSIHSHSIILVKKHDHGQIQDYLNLCPFIVDKHAFLEKDVPHISMFSHQVGDVYHYLAVSYNINSKEDKQSYVFSTSEDKLFWHH